MIKPKILKSISVISLAAALLFSAAPVWAAVPKFLLANVKCADVSAETAETVAGQSAAYQVAPACDLCDFIQIFVNGADMMVALSGTIAVLIFVYAGLMYLTVSFKPDNAARGKAAATAAVIGIAFIFGAYTIINFVIITFVGGTSNMSYLYKITGQESWGVCANPPVGSAGQSR